MPSIDPSIKQNRSLYWGGLVQLAYGLIEIPDCIAIVLIAAGFLPNLYLSEFSGFSGVYAMMENMPIVFVPIFWFFMSLRLLSAYWVLTNKAKGVWLALLVSGITVIAAFFLLPFGAGDLIGVWPVIVLLLNGYFKDQPIVQEPS
jgi:hypothetical protein